MTLRRWTFLVFSVGFTISASGQEPAEPGPTEPLPTPTQILDPSPRVMSADEPARNEEPPNPSPGEPTVEELLAPVLGETLSREEQVRSKKWRVIPFGRVGVTADDNVFIQPTNKQKDVYFTLSPGIAIGWGNYEKEVKALGEFAHYFEVPEFELEREVQNFAFAKYSPTVTLFSDLSGEDAFDHDALLAGRWEFTKLILGARTRFQTLSGPDFDTNTRTDRTVLTSAFNSSYDVSEKTKLELNATNETFDYANKTVGRPGQASQTLQNSTETIAESWLNYQLTPKTAVSLGGRVGFLDLQSSPSQTYEQIRIRATYSASGKLGFVVSGGTEFRQVANGRRSDPYTVFSFGGVYKPFEGTSIYATAFRQNSASVTDPGSNVNSTGISARIKQRFFQRCYLQIEGSYRNSKYVSLTTGADSGRTDDYLFAKSSFSFDITKHLSAEFAYEHVRDDSSESAFSFVENLVSAQLNFQF